MVVVVLSFRAVPGRPKFHSAIRGKAIVRMIKACGGPYLKLMFNQQQCFIMFIPDNFDKDFS